MSRIIVFNLPKTVTKNDLRESFSVIGNVINIQLIFTVDQEYCYFALIAYQTENEAIAALNLFDKSYLYSSRIKVERCSEIEDKKEVICNVEEILPNDEVNHNKTIKNTSQIKSSSDLKNLPDEEGQLNTTDVTEKKVYSIPLLLLFEIRETFCQVDHDYIFRGWDHIKNKNKKVVKLSSIVQSILNGITPENLILSIECFKALPINSIQSMEETVNLVFEKTINLHFAYYAASLTAAMQSVQVTYINSGSPKTVTFKNLMIEKCHTFFELNNIHGITNIKCNTLEINKMKKIFRKLRRRTLGNCRFIGELYKQQILPPKTILNYMLNLVVVPHHTTDGHDREMLIECLCDLIKTTGENLEQYYNLDLIFEKIENLKEIAVNSKNMLKDIQYLQRNNWVPQRNYELVKLTQTPIVKKKYTKNHSNMV